MKNKRVFEWVAGAVLIVSAAPASAMMITVTNAGFEDPVLGDGSYTSNSAPGWLDSVSRYGVFNPTASDANEGQIEGSNVGYSGNTNEGGVLGQDTSFASVAGAEYVLSVLVGSRSNLQSGSPIPFDYEVRLLDGATVIASASGSGDGDGNFSTVSIQGIGLGLGTLSIELAQIGAGQTLFDDVKLYSVPEPAVLLLFGAGLLGIGIARKRSNA